MNVKLQGQPVGAFLNPALSLTAARGSEGDLARLATSQAFDRDPMGAAVDDALDIKAIHNVDPGPRDFAGRKTPQGTAYDVGALERQPPP